MNKQILQLAIPNILSNITVPLLGIVDVMMMGRLGDPVYIGAIAVGGMIFNFLYWGFGFLRLSTSGFTAQAFGKQDPLEQRTVLFRALVVALSAAMFVVVIQVPVEKFSFWIIDASTEVEHYARVYFYVRIWAAPATISNYAFSGWFIGMQNARIPMTVNILINLSNIVLNYLFVFLLDMKTMGIALGTVLAQYFGLILNWTFLFYRYRIRFSWSDFQLLRNRGDFIKFFLVSRDIFLRTLALMIVLSFFTAASAKMNDVILSVNTLLFQFYVFFSYLVDGFSNAGEALTGKYIGSGNFHQLRRVIKTIFQWASGIALLFLIVYLFAAKYLLYLIVPDESILDASRSFIPWMIWIPVVSFAAFIWDGIYVGATSSTHLRNSALLASMMFLVTFYIFYPFTGNHALWMAFYLFLLVRGLYLTLLSPKAIFSMVKK